MKRIVAVAIAAFVVFPFAAEAQRSTRVRSHVTTKGTIVQPHRRTVPNKTKLDNWSSKPNTNPYTGKTGRRDPLALPKLRTARRR